MGDSQFGAMRRVVGQVTREGVIFDQLECGHMRTNAQQIWGEVGAARYRRCRYCQPTTTRYGAQQLLGRVLRDMREEREEEKENA